MQNKLTSQNKSENHRDVVRNQQEILGSPQATNKQANTQTTGTNQTSETSQTTTIQNQSETSQQSETAIMKSTISLNEVTN